MRFLAVDDEPLMLKGLVSALHSARPEAEVLPFRWPEDALEELKNQPADVAFLDIQMGGMTGLQLAMELKKIKPDIHVIFVTGYSQYAVDAFAIHATGYLLKPVEKEDIERELTFIYGEQKSKSHVQVKTFGGFEIFVDGQPVRFERTKAKELLAYLVDRRGAAVTSGEAYAALFEDAGATPSGKSYFRTILHELTRALKKAGAEEILRKDWNSYAVRPETFDCDLYRFLEGDPVAASQYQNDYLPAYSWAEIRNGELYFRGGETTK
ncbi:response regulator [Hungatella hathewayi]|nr:response regulator [Hungatella hathewayi]